MGAKGTGGGGCRCEAGRKCLMPEAPVSSLVSGGVPMMWYRACDLSCWCVGRKDTLLPADT